MEPGHIFVSYSRWDRARALSLVARLREGRLSTWMCGPEWHCPAWQETVFPRIDDCSALLVVASPHADAADGVRQEIAYAKRLGKPVIEFQLNARNSVFDSSKRPTRAP